jgi:uncharacterized membrane protein
MHRLRRFLKHDRGAVAVVFAAALPALVGLAALAVDIGSVYLTSRKLQGAADLAAMAAARDIDHADAAADATVAANAIGASVTTKVVTGVYSPDPAVAPGDRFQPAAGSPNAAQVTLTAGAPLYFGQLLTGRQSFTVSRKATAARAQLASFQIGTRLAALQGGVENSLLSALTGSNVNLSVMDYNALLSANVDLFQYVDALRTRLALQGASFSTVLSSRVSAGTALGALADALASAGDGSAAAAAAALAQAAANMPLATLSGLLDLGPYAAQDHITAGSGSGVSVTAMDLASAILTLTAGGRQVQFDLGASAPGLESLTVYLAIGQRPSDSPWIAIDDDGSVTVSTQQARLYLDARIGPSSALSALGVSQVEAPIYVELAKGQAKLAALTCGDAPADERVDLSVSPSLGELALGAVDTRTLNDFTTPESVSPATLVNLLLIKATASALVNIGGGAWTTVPFTASDISAGAVKTVQTSDILSATVASLIANTQIGVQLGGLGLGLGAGPVAGALQSALASAAAPLDQVLNAVTSLIGLKLGEADVKVNGVRCKGAALVA